MIGCVEIPCTDLPRASSFYGALVGRPLRHHVLLGVPHALFTSASGAFGVLVADPSRVPSDADHLVYFAVSSESELDVLIERAVAAGGDVLLPKTDVGQQRFMAIVRDSENNRVALHVR